MWYHDVAAFCVNNSDCFAVFEASSGKQFTDLFMFYCDIILVDLGVGDYNAVEDEEIIFVRHFRVVVGCTVTTSALHSFSKIRKNAGYCWILRYSQLLELLRDIEPTLSYRALSGPSTVPRALVPMLLGAYHLTSAGRKQSRGPVT